MKEKILLTRAEVGGLLRVKPRSVARLKGLVPIRINSRLLRYRRDDVELWLGQFPKGESNTVDDQRSKELITIIEESGCRRKCQGELVFREGDAPRMKQIIIPPDIGSKPYLGTVSLYHDKFGWVLHPLRIAACGCKQPIDDMALGAAGVDR